MTAEQLIEENIELIDRDDFQTFYDEKCEGLNGSIIRRCHQIFYEADIDPIRQGNMTNIPRCYWSTEVKTKTYEIPAYVEKIGELAFARSHIDKLLFADYGKCHIIQQNAFEKSDIAFIELPESLEMIEYGAFNGCKNLKDIYYMGTKDDWNYVKLSVNFDLSPGYLDSDVPAKVIHCIDGDLDIYDNE